MSIENLESEHGLSLVVHSSGQSPTNFTNILKHPVRLGTANWEVALANIHIPTFQQSLIKDDFERSCISFNMGLFTHNQATGEWVLLKNSNKELWRMSPDKTFDGMDDRYIDVDIERTRYMRTFVKSLKLGSHAVADQSCLNLFLNTISGFSGKNEKLVFDEYLPRGIGDLKLKSLPTNMQLEDVYRFFEELMYIKGINSLSYIKQAAITYGRNGEDYINDIFQKILAKMKSEGTSPKLGELYYNEKYKKLFDKLWKSHTLPPQPEYIVRNSRSANTSDYAVDLVLQDEHNDPPVMALYATFGDRMAKFLSIDSTSKIFMGHCLHPLPGMLETNKTLIPKFERMKIESYFIYSDLVKQAVRIGNTISNLLAIVSVSERYSNMAAPLIIFKPLAHSYFHSVSVKIRDQNGDDISFESNSYSALEILIRRRRE